jgi:glycosyltransferase involved in cell wall biosynthesis
MGRPVQTPRADRGGAASRGGRTIPVVRKQILVIGTAPGARSGIAAVVQVYMAHGLFRRWNARYLPTHADGGRVAKALLAARSWLKFLGLLFARRVALLHVLLASNASFWRKALFVLPARLAGVPYVLHLHCGKFEGFYARALPSTRALVRLLLRGARAVVGLSRQDHQLLSRIEPSSRLLTIPNPVLVPDQAAPLRDGRPTVLFLGVFTPAKGVYDLLDAWPAVLRLVPHARLVLCGAGEEEGLHARATQLDIGHSLEMPGWISGAAKAAFIRQAWVFALPSHAEALPMCVLEAMAAGVPVVASRVGGIPTAVAPGVTGELVEIRDIPALSRAIAGLLSDHERRLAMGRAARENLLRTYAADTVVPKLDALWRAATS